MSFHVAYICKGCGYADGILSNPTGRKFCPHCGEEIISACPDCGEAIKGVEKFTMEGRRAPIDASILKASSFVLSVRCDRCGKFYPWVK